jgi:CheY-like chemotaxis protein
MKPVFRILVVDDDPLLTHTLAGALQETCQAQVWAAGSGQEGVRLVALHQPDLVLLDLDMPGVDGLDVCRALRRPQQATNSAIWILTGLPPESERLQETAALADRVLLKPISLMELTLAIQETITPHGPRLEWVP